ncbi:MAG: DUF4178 domain-containing protein [Myxococcaceae bacterium]
MTEGKCPSCGAPVQFTAGSARILVCPSCSTVIARNDGGGFDAGAKFAALVDTDSPLSVGLGGSYRGAPFRVVGRLQKSHGAGTWDEWYLAFDDGREGWLSESEGEWHLMFPAAVEAIYRLVDLQPMSRIDLGNNRFFFIEEIGRARVVTAEGQLPDDVDTAIDADYVDATGLRGAFVSLDYSKSADKPEVFIGSAVKFAELGFDKDSLRPRVHRIQLQQARCTQCNGPLELKAPDATKRVACPFCNALLDVSAGKLSFLQQLEKPSHTPWIPIGKKGKLFDVEWTCIAFLIRSCRVDGVTYSWDEYLLYNAQEGFRWLMLQNGHWVFLTPIPAGEVGMRPAGGSATYENRSYKLFQRVTAITNYVVGECYWQVKPGEVAVAAEYIAPPYDLNMDGNEREVTWTRGEYVHVSVIRKAFELRVTPAPSGIAPCQPNEHSAKAIDGFKWASIYAAAIFVLYFVFSAMAPERVIYEGSVTPPPNTASASPESIMFSEPFDVPNKANLAMAISATPLNNSWAGLELDLVNDQTGEVISTYGEMEYYSGSDSDGPWSEGSRSDTKYVSEVDKGRYLLRFVPYFPTSSNASLTDAMTTLPTYTVRVVSDSPHFVTVFLCWLLLFVWPVTRAILSSTFETRRWEDSNISSGGSA